MKYYFMKTLTKIKNIKPFVPNAPFFYPPENMFRKGAFGTNGLKKLLFWRKFLSLQNTSLPSWVKLK